MVTHAIRAVAVLTVVAASVLWCPPPAAAQAFDGEWSVNIITRRGACNASYRIGVLIRGGYVYYAGGGGVNVSGRVARSGSVSVSVASAGQSAAGSGRLSGNRGSGSWRGQGSAGVCSGVWVASRG
jgi:hypothetical protein